MENFINNSNTCPNCGMANTKVQVQMCGMMQSTSTPLNPNVCPWGHEVPKSFPVNPPLTISDENRQASNLSLCIGHKVGDWWNEWYSGFHNREHLNREMALNHGFHAGDDVYIVKPYWNPLIIIVFKVKFDWEKNYHTDKLVETRGVVKSHIELDIRSLSSAISLFTQDSSIGAKITETLMPFLVEALNKGAIII